MENFLRALDSGENGHSQHTWAQPNSFSYETPISYEKSYFEEKITQISFQLVRGGNIRMYEETLQQLKTHGPEYRIYLTILFKLCAHTRDIVNGKGECKLAYEMLLAVYKHYPAVGIQLLRSFLILEIDGKEVHPYGSWKDINQLSVMCKTDFGFLDHIVTIVKEQLKKDELALNEGRQISLLGKWVPRENSKHGWLFGVLACNYASIRENPTEKTLNYCKMKFRKLLSSLNKKLDTTQIKQCDRKWATINPETVTSVTMFRNKKAFLNKKKDGQTRSCENDRITCAENFNKFLDNAEKGETTVKGKRIGLNEFTKQALDSLTSREIQMLNLQWKDNSSQNGNLDYMVPLVDVSGSMAGDPLHAAIALGIRVAEKSRLGKRLLTFSETPEWLNLQGIDGFVDMVKRTAKAKWGMTTDFAKALDLILEVVVQQKMSADLVKQLSLVVFSDMMINAADKNYDSMYEMIKQKYHDAGMKIHGVPYELPHILFWNLRSTNGFPNLAKQRNTTMLSGFSPMLLNLFCEKGAAGLEKYTPWSMLLESLDHPRYTNNYNF